MRDQTREEFDLGVGQSVPKVSLGLFKECPLSYFLQGSFGEGNYFLVVVVVSFA